MTELLEKGDLHHLLKQSKLAELLLPINLFRLLTIINSNESSLREEGSTHTPMELLNYCRHICQGMCYLSAKHFIHRDLAARNVLVSKDGICKVVIINASSIILCDDCN